MRHYRCANVRPNFKRLSEDDVPNIGNFEVYFFANVKEYWFPVNNFFVDFP